MQQAFTPQPGVVQADPVSPGEIKDTEICTGHHPSLHAE
jgi:hypothetical protein